MKILDINHGWWLDEHPPDRTFDKVILYAPPINRMRSFRVLFPLYSSLWEEGRNQYNAALMMIHWERGTLPAWPRI